MSALSKAIKDTSKTLAGQSQFLQDNREEFEVIGVNVGQLGKFRCQQEATLPLRGILSFKIKSLSGPK